MPDGRCPPGSGPGDDIRESGGTPPSFGSVLLIGVWLGLLAGLGEGPISILLLKLGRLRELWYDVLWVAPAFDALLGAAAALSLALFASLALPGHRIRLAAAGGGFVIASIWLSLLLPYQVHTWALLLLAGGAALRFGWWFDGRSAAALRFFRSSLPVLLGCTLCLAVGIRAGGRLRERSQVARLPAAAADSPDVLLIVIDALRGDHVHANGYARPTSPVLDSLAAAGASFQAAFAPSPYTAPSHGSLLTGLLPGAHGAQWGARSPVLDRQNATLPERLLGLGYRTGAFSANRFWFTREQGFGRGFLHFEDRYHHLGDMIIRTAYGREIERLILKRFLLDYPWRKTAAQVNDALLAWIDRDQGRPFFAFINYFDVHDPYRPPEPWGSRFAGRPSPGGLVNSFRGVYEPDLTPVELRSEIDAYDASLAWVDAEIGNLLSALRERGLTDDLLVVVTSDHGEAFGEHGTFVHANSLYFEEIHVPLILSQPGRIPPGFRSGTAVTNASVPATILDLAGAEQSVDPAAAPSLALLWRDSAAARAWPLPAAQMEHWPWMPESSPSHYGAIASVQDDRFHFILHDSLGASLFDWRQDPGEQADLRALDREGLPGEEATAAGTRLALQLDSIMRRCGEIRPGCGPAPGR